MSKTGPDGGDEGEAGEEPDEVHLSLSAASQRLRRLRQSGAIERFTIRLDSEAVGPPIDAPVALQLAAGAPWSGIDDALQENPEVVDASTRVVLHTVEGFPR